MTEAEMLLYQAQWPMNLHVIKGEQGPYAIHPGYWFKHCVTCGQPFPLGKRNASGPDTCGRESCEKEHIP